MWRQYWHRYSFIIVIFINFYVNKSQFFKYKKICGYFEAHSKKKFSIILQYIIANILHYYIINKILCVYARARDEYY